MSVAVELDLHRSYKIAGGTWRDNKNLNATKTGGEDSGDFIYRAVVCLDGLNSSMSAVDKG
jgi:hypothetical protein